MAGHRRYFTLLETEEGRKHTTERLQDGSVLWEENPSNLEERCSLAKVLRSKECEAGVSTEDLRELVSAARALGPASSSHCKNWARSTFAHVVGEVARPRQTKRDKALAQARKDEAKDEQAKKLAKNQALAERGVSFIPLQRSQPAKQS